MNIENLETDLISFELSDEDVQAIRGSGIEEATVYGAYRCYFPFPITCVVLVGFPTSGNNKPGLPKLGTPISTTPKPVVQPTFFESQA
ncbi:MAG: hypothetical protein PUP92_37315 [Rhizonema sp. PD38]|nr:hypothetical protein [Rhizonema sp. PD38]